MPSEPIGIAEGIREVLSVEERERTNHAEARAAAAG